MKTLTLDAHVLAQRHFQKAFDFWDDHGQGTTALGELSAGLLALSVQVQRIELAVMEAASNRDC